LLVPMSSSTSVAAGTWPTWVVSQRNVLEAVFVLLESPSPLRRIFIGSHSLPPPLRFAVSVLDRRGVVWFCVSSAVSRGAPGWQHLLGFPSPRHDPLRLQ
jgi:hypothetical protein